MRKLVIVLMLFAVLFLGYKVVKAQSLTSQSIRYESGLFWATASDGIAGYVVNYDSSSHNYRVIISYYNGGTTPTTLVDTGTTSVAGGATRAVGGYTVPGGVTDNFLVEITVDSDRVVPTISVANGANPPRYWQTGSQMMRFKDNF